MQDVLKGIWSALGVPQLWGGILTLIVILAVWVIKVVVDRALKNQAAEFANRLQTETARQTLEFQASLQKAVEDQKLIQSQYGGIAAYVQEQYASLIDAYVRLFEDEGARTTPAEFAKIAAKADNDVMRVFRKYQPLLDRQTSEKIYYLHNILAQFTSDPSADAIQRFRSWKAEFFNHIRDVQDIAKPELILYRRGIISSIPTAREEAAREENKGQVPGV